MIEFREFVEKSNEIVITTHFSPDGDAIGSSVFLFHILQNMAKRATIVLPDSPPSFLNSFLENVDHHIFETNPEHCVNIILKADLIIHLDFNAINRLGKDMSKVFEGLDKTQIMIDHHPNPTFNCDLTISRPEVSSTCELIFSVLEKNQLLDFVCKKAAKSCYLGMMTDTGSFRFPSVTSDTHRVIEFLLKMNINHFEIHEKIYDSNTINRLKLRGYAISEKLELIHSLPIGIIMLDKNELIRFSYEKGDTEGLVNTILSIQGVEMAIFMMEKENEIKMSFRSKGEYYVNDFAKKYFDGGGHKYAAGGVSRVNLDDTLIFLKKSILDYYG